MLVLMSLTDFCTWTTPCKEPLLMSTGTKSEGFKISVPILKYLLGAEPGAERTGVNQAVPSSLKRHIKLRWLMCTCGWQPLQDWYYCSVIATSSKRLSPTFQLKKPLYSIISVYRYLQHSHFWRWLFPWYLLFCLLSISTPLSFPLEVDQSLAYRSHLRNIFWRKACLLHHCVPRPWNRLGIS